uniref:Uncharacterized protein n=1 Tax=Anopheles dirus TaxID=7168 RepID=A0A182MXE9_9DIPT
MRQQRWSWPIPRRTLGVDETVTGITGRASNARNARILRCWRRSRSRSGSWSGSWCGSRSWNWSRSRSRSRSWDWRYRGTRYARYTRILARYCWVTAGNFGPFATLQSLAKVAVQARQITRLPSGTLNRLHEACRSRVGLSGLSFSGQLGFGWHVAPGLGPVHGMAGSQQARSGQSQYPLVGVSCLKCWPGGQDIWQRLPLSHL